MLSYKEYKQLNESLYGAINLGIKTPSALAGVVGATGASEEISEIESQPTLDEAKKACKCGKKMCAKCKMMKKGMEDEELEDEEESEDEDSKEKESDEESEDEESEEESEDEESEEEDDDEEEEKEMMKKGSKKCMKKKSKKEWNEILADFDSLLEGRTTEVISQVKNNLEEIKKLLESKEMTEEEKAWWTSVNSQLANPQPGQYGYSPVGKIAFR
jgi:hypothetical protein